MASVERVDTNLKSSVIEQVMRLADDELSVLPFIDAEPRTARAFEALGRLIGDVTLALRSGTPLVVFCHGGQLTDTWRAQVDTATNSLWGNLEMLRSLYGAGDAEDPYTELCQLRDLSDAEMRN